MEQLLLIAGIVTAFYLLIPGLGAFTVRSRWRQFRARFLDSSMFPVAGYEQFRRGSVTAEGAVLGEYRFFGTLEAIQGDDLIWVRSGRVSFAADMRGVKVYVLYPVQEMGTDVLPDQAPQELSWRRVGSLPEGSKAYVAGVLEAEHGRAVFRNRKQRLLTVVLYDGPDSTLLARAIWSARQRNEYWNQFTAVSLMAGTFALLLIAYIFLHSPLLRLASLTALTLCAVPVAPLLPPGIVLFFLYRRWWRRGRYFRAQRDLVRLPLRYFPDGADAVEAVSRQRSTSSLADGKEYTRRVVVADRLRDLGERGARERAVPEIEVPVSADRTYVAFGASAGPTSQDPNEIREPEDPMAEFLIYRDDPARIAEICSRRARRWELVAALAFAVGFLLNLYELFLVVSNIIR